MAKKYISYIQLDIKSIKDVKELEEAHVGYYSKEVYVLSKTLKFVYIFKNTKSKRIKKKQEKRIIKTYGEYGKMLYKRLGI